MHFMLEYSNDRLVAREDVWMNPEWDSSVLIVVVLQIDSAILMFSDSWPSCRFEVLAREETFDTSFQLPRFCPEEFDISGQLNSVSRGDFNGLRDGPLQAALVFLPSYPGALTTDPQRATSRVDSSSDQSVSKAKKETLEEHRSEGPRSQIATFLILR